MKRVLLFLCAAMLASQAWAYDFEAEGLYFNITGDNIAEVTYPNYNNSNYYDGYTKPTGSLNIPAKVTNSSTSVEYDVTSIGYSAFLGCSGLTSITIPNSVTSIGNSAFSGCIGLTSVTIPNSVTSIGSSAFSGCSGLTSVNIPNSVTSIGSYAFYKCSSLTSVTIPNSVKSIGSYAFYGCSGLTSVTIPNSVTSIGERAFNGCSGLTSITIPNSVTSIGSYAFNGCSGLTSITIPNSVTSIGSSAFYGCSGLTSITIPLLSGKAIGTNFATLKNTILYFESENPQSQFSSSSIYTKAKNNVKAMYVGCKVIRAAVNDEECGSVATSGENLAVKGDDGSLWYLKETKNGTATLTASAKEGYHFVWWDDDDESATDNPRNVTVTQSRTYTAVFEADEPTALAANDTQDMKVATAHGAIVITNATSEVWVYDIAGQCIAHELPAQKITISPNKKGLFVVKSHGAQARVLVY